jgi:hypothetical protein
VDDLCSHPKPHEMRVGNTFSAKDECLSGVIQCGVVEILRGECGSVDRGKTRIVAVDAMLFNKTHCETRITHGTSVLAQSIAEVADLCNTTP